MWKNDNRDLGILFLLQRLKSCVNVVFEVFEKVLFGLEIYKFGKGF